MSRKIISFRIQAPPKIPIPRLKRCSASARPARRKEGRAWLRTALPCFSHAAPARGKGWSGLGCARPSPVSPILRQLAEKDGQALAAHGPPLFLPCCASSRKRMVRPWLRTALPCFSHAAPARMGAACIFFHAEAWKPVMPSLR